MNDRLFVLLVQGETELLQPLRSLLKELSVQAYGVQTCEEAGRLLSQTEPQLVFTVPSLPDGSWLDIIGLVESMCVLSNVVIAAPAPDVRLFMSAMDRGAYDFFVPPFRLDALNRLVGSARRDVAHRKAMLASAACA